MTSSDRAAAPVSPGGAFALATLPARWVSRYRPDLAASVRADQIAFDGSRRALFAALALIAVGYPIVASIIHAVIGPMPTKEFIDYATSPYFYVVYLESIPFMVAVAGIGYFSPALGVLLIAVFAPADLAAVFALSANYHTDVGALNQVHPVQGGVPARLISYLVLWIVAVEIPLRARGWVAEWRESRTGPPSRVRGALIAAVLFALPVALWTYAALWVVQPVANWIYNGSANLVTALAAGTWMFGWMVVLGAAVIAFVADLIRPPRADVDEVVVEPEPRRGLARQFVTVAVMSVLLAGLMQGLLEGILIVGGLVIAGPILTLLLPRVRLPGVVSGMRPVLRWAMALALVVAATWLATSAASSATANGQISDYLLIAILLAVLMPVFRIVAEAGATRAQSDGQGGSVPPVVTALLQLLVMAVVWLALPAVVLAHDPPESGVTNQYPLSTAALVAGATAAAADVARRARKRRQPQFDLEVGEVRIVRRGLDLEVGEVRIVRRGLDLEVGDVSFVDSGGSDSGQGEKQGK